MRRGQTILGALGLVLLAACAEQPWSPSNPAGPVTSEPLNLAVQCRVDVASRSMECLPPPAVLTPAGGGRIILGGQGNYLLLASSATSYNSVVSDTFFTTVTLQNRSAQPMGSTDGHFPDGQGIRVFFTSGPTVTGGTGAVTIYNADSTYNITAPGQQAFVYGQLLLGNQVSSPKIWKFKVPNTVTAFTFNVQVSANIPQLNGVLRWRQDGGRLNGISCSSSSLCNAVGNLGTVRGWNGVSWNWSNTGTTQNLNGVATVSSTFAMAVGDSGTVLVYNGTYWKGLTSGTSATLHGVWCASVTDCYIVGNGGAILRWNGTTFTSINNTSFTDDMYGIWGVSASDIWLAADKGLALHWNGTSWSDIGPPPNTNFRAVWGSATNDVYVVGQNGSGGTAGEVWRWNGTTWTQQTNPVSVFLNGVGGTGATNVYAIGANGKVIKTVNSGGTWTDVSATVNVTQGLYGIAGSGTSLFFVGGGGTLVTSSNSGTSFAASASGTENTLNGVWGTSASNVWAVGAGGVILHWDGAATSKVTSPTTADLNFLWGTAANDIYAVGAAGTVLHYNGTTWTAATVGTANWRGAWGSASNNVYIVGDTGAARIWNGTTWTPVTIPDTVGNTTIRNFNAIWGTAASDIYAIGDTGLIVHFNGVSWLRQPYETSFPQNRDLHAIWGTAPNDIWAVARHTVVLHNNLVIDPLLCSGPCTGPWDHAEVDGTTDVNSVWGSGPGDVYAVADSGIVLHQNDADLSTGGTGMHWNRFNKIAPDNVNLRGVWSADQVNIFIVGTNGFFWHGVR